MLLPFLAGVAAGAVHVVTGPDHVAAVAPLSVHAPEKGVTVGLRWGIGHVAGVTVLAGAGWLLRGILPLDAISAGAERAVGVLLIVLGLWGLRAAFRTRAHAHTHTHDGVRHHHVHLHGDGAHPPEEDHAGRAHRHSHAALGIGALHGLAGTSHVVAILPALAMPGPDHAAIYLGGYAAGTIAAMTAVTWALSRLALPLGRRGPRALRGLLVATALVAIGVGAAWLGAS